MARMPLEPVTARPASHLQPRGTFAVQCFQEWCTTKLLSCTISSPTSLKDNLLPIFLIRFTQLPLITKIGHAFKTVQLIRAAFTNRWRW